MLRLLSVLVLVPACISPLGEPPPPEAPEYDLPGGDAACPHGEPAISLHQLLPCDGGFCPIATGGTMRIDVHANYWQYAHVIADEPLLVEPGPYDDVVLRATATGSAQIEVRAQRCEGRDEEVFHPITIESLPVAHVRLRAMDEIFTNNPASSYVVYSTDRIGWHTSRERIEIELAPAGAGVTAPKYLTDSSVRLGAGTSAGIEQLTAGTLLATAPGVHDIVLDADSFGRRQFQIHAFDHVDRIEARVDRVPMRPGDLGSVCFFAFAGDYEVAVAHTLYEFTYEAALGGSRRRHDNCREFKATSPGIARVMVEIDGAEHSVEFPIAP